MSSAEDSLRRLAKVADCIIGGTIFLCVAVLLYYVYYYNWTQQRYFASPVGSILYYILPAALAGLLLVSLWLRPRCRINLALVLTSIAISLYTIELVLAFFISSEEVRIAKEFGIDFDVRSPLKVIFDLQKQHISAVPDVFPQALLERQADGTRKSKITVNGTEILPLGGIANRTTIFCNDGGKYVIYESDEHGFHNPIGIWNAGYIDVVAVGDSFVQGSCVPSDQNFVALVRKRYRDPLTLNLGKMGNGPLTELATLKEYLPSLKPKVVLWFYFEGNDYRDLRRERDAALLTFYLSDNFTQRLLNRQTDIDQVLMASIERWSKTTISKRRLEKITTSFKMGHLRSRLGFSTRELRDARALNLDPSLDLDLFGRILMQAQALVQSWHGMFYFVYLPERARYTSLEIANKDRDRVLTLVRTIGMPIIDIHPVFQAYRDPLALFPFRRKVHYNEEGHRLVAEEVLRSAIRYSKARSFTIDGVAY